MKSTVPFSVDIANMVMKKIFNALFLTLISVLESTEAKSSEMIQIMNPFITLLY